MAEDEMVGWCHRLNEHDFEQTPGNSEDREAGVLQSVLSQKIVYD